MKLLALTRACAVFLGDMYIFHPETAGWANITGPLAGSPPLARMNHGFTASDDGSTYCFGGIQLSSGQSVHVATTMEAATRGLLRIWALAL